MAPLPLIPKGVLTGNGTRFTFDYKGPDTALAINRLFKDGAHVAFDGPSHVAVTGVARTSVETAARDFGLSVKASAPDARTKGSDGRLQSRQPIAFHAPRIGMYQPWTGGNMDEGWTRWVLEQYGFTNTPIHNADIRAGKLRQKFDAIILADQEPRSHHRRVRRARHPAGIPRRHRPGGRRQPEAVRRRRRHVDRDGQRVRPRDRAAADPGARHQERPDARSALRTRRDPAAGGRYAEPERLRRRGRHVRLLHQQSVLRVDRRFQLAAHQRRRALSEHECDRVWMAEGRRADGGTSGGRVDRHESREGRAVRPAPAAPRADARDVPAAVQRAVPVRAGRRSRRRRERRRTKPGPKAGYDVVQADLPTQLVWCRGGSFWTRRSNALCACDPKSSTSSNRRWCRSPRWPNARRVRSSSVTASRTCRLPTSSAARRTRRSAPATRSTRTRPAAQSCARRLRRRCSTSIA